MYNHEQKSSNELFDNYFRGDNGRTWWHSPWKKWIMCGKTTL